MENWKELREAAGLTVEDLAKRAGYGVGTISDLENHGKGSRRLKKALREILLAKESSESENGHSPAKARTPSLHEPPAESDLALWKRRAMRAESQLAGLRSALRSLIELSSTTLAPDLERRLLEELEKPQEQKNPPPPPDTK